MDYFNYGMRQHGPATQPLALSDIDTCLRKTYENKFLYRTNQYSNDYIDLQAVAQNIEHLNMKLDTQATHPQLQSTIDSMATIINKLADENHELTERLNRLEMLLGEN